MPHNDFLRQKSGEFLVRRKNKRVNFKFLIVSFSFLTLGGLFIFLVHFSLYSDFMTVKSSEVKGVDAAKGGYVKQTLIREMIGSGGWRRYFGPDNMLFWIIGKKPDFTKVDLPFLASLNLETNLAGRDLEVSVKEREFFAVWCLSDGHCFSIDQDGIVFAEAPEIQGSLILKINDENTRTLVLGNSVVPNNWWLGNVFESLRLIKARGFSVSSVKIKDFGLEEWEAQIYSGPSFYFSLNFVPENFSGVIDSVSKKLDLTKLSYLDFRVPGRIYYK